MLCDKCGAMFPNNITLRLMCSAENVFVTTKGISKKIKVVSIIIITAVLIIIGGIAAAVIFLDKRKDIKP